MFPTLPNLPVSSRHTPRRRFSSVVMLCLILACAAISAWNAPAARAADFVVTTLNDSEGETCGADCSLRQAINAGNGGVTNITFAVSGTIRLLRALPELEGTMTISNTQEGSVTISGDTNNDGGPDKDDVRIFAVARKARVMLDRLIINNGFHKSAGGGIYNAGMLIVNNSVLASNSTNGSGGGISNVNSLTVTNSLLMDNSATYGGGIDNSSGDTLTIISSTLSSNTAEYGGGVGNAGTVTIINATLFNNSAKDGGGINNFRVVNVMNSTLSYNSAPNGGGIYNKAELTVTDSTITSNSATTGGGIAASVRSDTGTSVNNSIVSGNSGLNGAAGTDVEFISTRNSFTSGGYNLIGNGNAIARFAQAGDQAGVTDPRLGPLQDNGGPTQTHALLPGSRAINGGNPNADPNSFDQRGPGFPRVRAGRMDIGAFELQVDVVPNPPVNAADDSYTLIIGALGQTQQAGVTFQTTGVFLINAPGVLANDSDPSGGALTARLASAPQHARLLLRPDGTLFLLPNAGYIGADSFTYIASNGQTESQATVRFNIVDKRVPEIAFDTPPNGARIKAITRIAGRVRDKQSGVRSVALSWKRFDGAYWNGSAWTANAVQLPLALQGFYWTYTGKLPAPGTDRTRSLLDGVYELTATATDNSGNTNPIVNRVLVKNATSTLTDPTPPTTPGASTVRLSSATASSAQGLIILNFTGALDANVASNKANYRMGVNRVLVAIGAATYNSNAIRLSGFDLAPGDNITLQIGNLRDASGKTIAGGTIQLVAR